MNRGFKTRCRPPFNVLAGKHLSQPAPPPPTSGRSTHRVNRPRSVFADTRCAARRAVRPQGWRLQGACADLPLSPRSTRWCDGSPQGPSTVGL